MKKLSFIAILLAFVVSLFVTVNVNAYVSVKGYYKSNGTYVAPHVRSNPNGLKYDNYSYTPSQGLYNDSYGTKGSTWDTPTYITDPDYYTGKSIYDSQNNTPYSAPNYIYTTPALPTCPNNSYYDSLNSNCKCKNGYVVFGSECVDGLNYCISILGGEAMYNSLFNKCVCKNGFVLNDSNSQCITEDEKCKSQYGQNSAYYSVSKDACMYCTGDRIVDTVKDTCSCQDGYHWDQASLVCVVNPQCSGDQFLGNDNRCHCADGYVFKNNKCLTYNEDCIDTFGPNVFGNKNTEYNSNCNCVSGYQWNSEKTSCIEVPQQNNQASTTVESLNFIFTKNFKFGARDKEVGKLQQTLKEKGYYKIKVTNYFGTFTRSALKKFQSDNGLVSDGIVGPETRELLNNL